jgi:hypothetical protein
MELLHEGMVLNTFDEDGTWGLQTQGAKVYETPQKKRKSAAPTSFHGLPERRMMSPKFAMAHHLQLWRETTSFKKLEASNKKPRPRGRCRQCLADGRPDVFTSYVCHACNDLFLCNEDGSQKKQKHECFRRWHVDIERKTKDSLGYNT